MRIRKGVVALVGAGLLGGAGAVSYVDVGRSADVGEVACNVNNDDGIGGGGNRCGKRKGKKARGVNGVRGVRGTRNFRI